MSKEEGPRPRSASHLVLSKNRSWSPQDQCESYVIQLSFHFHDALQLPVTEQHAEERHGRSQKDTVQFF